MATFATGGTATDFGDLTQIEVGKTSSGIKLARRTKRMGIKEQDLYQLDKTGRVFVMGGYNHQQELMLNIK